MEIKELMKKWWFWLIIVLILLIILFLPVFSCCKVAGYNPPETIYTSCRSLIDIILHGVGCAV